MKQLSQSYRSGALALIDVPPPTLQPGNVLVRNTASLISPGTERLMLEMARKSLVGKARERPDLVRQVVEKARREGMGPTIQAVMSRLDAPVPLGYASAGVVMAVGEGVEEFQPGDAVACAGAGYAVHAEIVAIPRNLCVKIPSRTNAPVTGTGALSEVRAVAFEEAAFAAIGAIALQGVRVADVRIGEVVAVIGLGLVGLLTVQLLKAAGCRVLGLDPNLARCHVAESVGCDAAMADNALLLDRLSPFVDGCGADVVIIAAATTSNEPIEVAARLCREKGRVVAVGAVNMDVPRRPFYEKELELRLSRSYGPGRYDPLYEEKGIDYPYSYVRWTERRNMAAFLDLVAQGKAQIQPLITHRFPIDRALDAYDLIRQDTGGEAVGVLLTYEPAERWNGGDGTPCSISSVVRSTPSAPRATSEHVKVGLIGAGAFGKSVLLPKLKAIPSVYLTMICTATGLSARHTAAKFGVAACTTAADVVLNDPTIDAVFIATRHHLHAPLVIKALQAGKHVFVEKPLALNEAELRSIVEARHAASSHILMVGYNRRFAPLTRRVKQCFTSRAGALAIHYRVNAGSIPRDHWVHDPHEGGGRIIGEVCHFADWLCYLIEAAPVKVYAQTLPGEGRYLPEDNVLITLSFGDGSVGTIHYLANGDSRVPKERIEVFGNGAVAVIDDFRSGHVMQHGKRTRLSPRFWARQDKGHTAELQAFVTAAHEGGVSPIPFEDAVLASLTTFEIHESLRRGVPVDVDLKAILKDPSIRASS
jgi:predicted dehydrogenase/threonine dehydrogenase-like Zn-dependent dehydrogenase